MRLGVVAFPDAMVGNVCCAASFVGTVCRGASDTRGDPRCFSFPYKYALDILGGIRGRITVPPASTYGRHRWEQ